MATVPRETGYRPSWGFNLRLSAYWFATSWKWFILLLLVLPSQVSEIVPGGERNQVWGSIFALGATWAIIGPYLFGRWSDRLMHRWGTRVPFIRVGIACTVIAFTILAGAPSLVWLAIGYLLIQISDDIGTGPYSALIPELVPESFRGRASSVMSMLQLSAQIVGSVVTLLMLDRTLTVAGFTLSSIQLIYLTMAAVNIFCGIVVIRLLDGLPRLPAPEPPATGAMLREWLKPWRDVDFRWVWANRFLKSLAFYLVQPYLLFFLADQVGVFELFGFQLADAETAAVVLVLTISLSGAAASVYAARVADRLGRKKLILASGAIIGLALFPLAVMTSYQAIWYLGIVFGVGYGLYLSADWALVSDILPDSGSYGADMGVWQSSIVSVQVFAGLFGIVITYLNRIQPGSGYTATIWLSAVIFMISALMILKVKRSF